jgi:hypothetical protein
MPRLTHQGLYEEPLSSAIPLAEWMQLVEVCQQLRGVPSKLYSGKPFVQVRPRRQPEYPLGLVLKQVRRSEPGRRLSKVFRLPEHLSSEFPRPFENVLKNLPVRWTLDA